MQKSFSIVDCGSMVENFDDNVVSLMVQGNEMYIRTAAIYLYDQEELSFYDIMSRARQRHEIVIGYRLAAMEQALINPPNKAVLRNWSINDVFIVLAEDE